MKSEVSLIDKAKKSNDGTEGKKEKFSVKDFVKLEVVKSPKEK